MLNCSLDMRPPAEWLHYALHSLCPSVSLSRADFYLKSNSLRRIACVVDTLNLKSITTNQFVPKII